MKRFLLILLKLHPLAQQATKMLKVAVLYYLKLEWFVWMCGLNGTGLVPGNTLTCVHVTKEKCLKHFGVPGSKNGYAIRHHG
jgi:hypothetical protein